MSKLLIYVIFLSSIFNTAIFASDDSYLDEYTKSLIGTQTNSNGDSIKNGEVVTNYSKIIVDVKFFDNETKQPITFQAGNLAMCLGFSPKDCVIAKEVTSDVNTLEISQQTNQNFGYFRLKNTPGNDTLKDNDFSYVIKWNESPDQKKDSNGIITKNTLLLYLNFDSDYEQYSIADAKIKEKEMTDNPISVDSKNTDTLLYRFKGAIKPDQGVPFPKVIISDDKRVISEDYATLDDKGNYKFDIDLSSLEENHKYYIIYKADGYLTQGELLTVNAKSDLYVFTNSIKSIKLLYDKRNVPEPASIPWVMIVILISIQLYIFKKIYSGIKVVTNLQDY